jgi:dipeptidyl aminopeptidase/acylaminoacyl peptidase
MNLRRALCSLALALSPFPLSAQKKPIALDEFLNASEIADARISPDGSAVAIEINAPDWKGERYKSDLWLWTRQSGALKALTRSGSSSAPVWSPDGRYIAFFSDRPLDVSPSDEDERGEEASSRIWVIPVAGGEPFPLYTQDLDAHALAWSPDGATIEFSAAAPLSKDAEDERETEWKDVIRWRERDCGDVLLGLPIEAALRENDKNPGPNAKVNSSDDKPSYPAGSTVIAHSAFEIDEIVPSPSGKQLAFQTGPVSHRLEDPSDSEIYLVAAKGGDVKQLTRNAATESDLAWDASGKHIFFSVKAASGSVEGPYRDVQGRIYSYDLADAKLTRLGGDFQGSWEDIAVASDGTLLATGLTGIDQGIYQVDGAKFTAVGAISGNYSHLHTALRGTAVAFTHSTINEPTQVFVAESLAAINAAKPVTALNSVFAERAQVEWQPYRWKSPDGLEVEGVLIYPPGKKGAKHLRMLTLIHGGPADADGDRFGADWYDWATLAAANGWLVFRPNYRGSSGYGDAFMLAISPHLVSAPGLDILSGVDALVKDGIADPDRLTIGGYSYGGYMTNWLITQTTRFKAAVTGAGAVEHAANWGNDDETFDDAWYLSGTPWEKPDLYQSEAAIFQINKVTTPTHIVGGAADIRVSYLEQVLLERALQKLNIPHELLVFPGEGHPLANDPWHGYIKVREELKWLQKYGGS